MAYALDRSIGGRKYKEIEEKTNGFAKIATRKQRNRNDDGGHTPDKSMSMGPSKKHRLIWNIELTGDYQNNKIVILKAFGPVPHLGGVFWTDDDAV